MDKRKKRIFIITAQLLNSSYNYKKGDIYKCAIYSNNHNNAIRTFDDLNTGGQCVIYNIISIEDNYVSPFTNNLIFNQ